MIVSFQIYRCNISKVIHRKYRKKKSHHKIRKKSITPPPIDIKNSQAVPITKLSAYLISAAILNLKWIVAETAAVS